MHKKRVSRLKEILRKEKVDGALYGVSGNMFYLLDDLGFNFQRTAETGGVNAKPEDFFYNKSDAILYVPVDNDPVLIATPERIKSFEKTDVEKKVSYFDRFQRHLHSHIDGERVAVGLSSKAHLERVLKEINPDIDIVLGEEYVESLRTIKDEQEIAVLKKLAELTDFAMGEVVKGIEEGISQYEIGDLIAEIGREHGASEIAFFPNAVFTQTEHPTSHERGAYKKHWPLEKNTAIAFDYGYVMNGYCSDFGRSFYFGKATDRIKSAYKALQAAQLKVIETIKPGDKINSYLQILLDELGRHGFSENLFKHAENVPMGHQIGINVHEHPWINKDVDQVFVPGMVMCIEPKLWLPGECYIRVEDMILINETGAESLTKFSRTMFEL